LAGTECVNALPEQTYRNQMKNSGNAIPCHFNAFRRIPDKLLQEHGFFAKRARNAWERT